MNFNKLKLKDIKINGGMLGNVGSFIKQNGSTLSMIGSIMSIGAALYTAFKASEDVNRIHEKYEADLAEMRSEGLETPERVKELKGTRNIHYVLAFRKPILFGLLAGGLTFTTHYLDGLAIGGLTTALALEKDRVAKMIENGKEAFGDVPWKEVEDKTIEDLMNEKFFTPDGPKVRRFSRTDGDLLFVETEEADWIQINRNDLQAVIDWAEEYTKKHALGKDSFYTRLGLPWVERPRAKDGSAAMKFWGPDHPFKAHLGKVHIYGNDMAALIYDNPSTTAWKAGVPGAKKFS